MKEKCPEGSIRIGSTCVKAVPKMKDQGEAEEDCRKMGGGLVSIHSQFEQDVIGRYLDSQSLTYNAWIGKIQLPPQNNFAKVQSKIIGMCTLV